MSKEEIELRKRKRRLMRLKATTKNDRIDERIRQEKEFDSCDEE